MHSDYRSSVEMCFSNIFSQFVSFHSPDSVFGEQMFLLLTKLRLSIFKHIILLVLHIDTLCLTQGYRDFFSVFSHRNFTVRSMVYF